MITINKIIGKGANRLCFEHPEDNSKCIKIAIDSKSTLFHEFNVYKQVKNYIGEYLPKYEEKMVHTNFGIGLVCQAIKDDNGQFAKHLSYYVKKSVVDNNLKLQIINFAEDLIRHDIFFYDFNLYNFVVQIKNEKKYLYYIDLKSFENYKPLTFLRLEKIITPLARWLMKRRLKRLLSVTKSI